LIATRTLAVLSAVCMVGAFALATLLPATLPLAQVVGMYDSRLLVALHDGVTAHLPGWVWLDLVLPVLLRPCWLPPASLGIVLAGAAMTVATRPGVPRSHRRRS
jgi:hypothetical protein